MGMFDDFQQTNFAGGQTGAPNQNFAQMLQQWMQGQNMPGSPQQVPRGTEIGSEQPKPQNQTTLPGQPAVGGQQQPQPTAGNTPPAPPQPPISPGQNNLGTMLMQLIGGRQ